MSQESTYPKESKRGWIRHPEYITWRNMRVRTTNPKSDSYARYGGRGIGICDSWRHSFSTFLRDMGPRPSSKHSIDRIDNSLGYFPGNCRWATATEQNGNRNICVKLTLNGKTLTVSDWARELGVNPATLYNRVKKGWSAERILKAPVTPDGRGAKAYAP